MRLVLTGIYGKATASLFCCEIAQVTPSTSMQMDNFLKISPKQADEIGK